MMATEGAPAHTQLRDEPVERVRRIWSAVLGVEVGADDDFFALGGTSVQALMIVNRVQDEASGILHPAMVFEAGSPRNMAAGLRRAAVDAPPEVLTPEAIDRGMAHLARRNNDPAVPIHRAGGRNRRAIFVLAPPRSGSTLLRVMLGGHPGLFAPPELYLLGFGTLAERRARLSGRAAFLAEGFVRAVMAVEKCDRGAAEASIEGLVGSGATTHAAYRWLQERIGDRVLVDKTPAYAQNPAALKRAEAEFADPFFIHLVRHPMAMVTSFTELRADRVTSVEADDALPASGPARGELWWLAAHRHVAAFLAGVPAARQHRVVFEALVADPRGELETLCARLGLAFDGAMLDPYADRSIRMTDGVTADARMLGDPGFHRRRGIDPSAADAWRDAQPEHALCAETVELAGALGYALDAAAPDREEWSF